MKTVLVTGVNGLLGSQVCKELLNRGHKVIALTRFRSVNEIANVSYVYVDLSKNWEEELLPDNVDTVIHLAQSKKFREFPEEADDVFKVNIESTAKLLNFSRKKSVSQFIYTSSGGVYGNSANAFNENSPIVSPGQLGFYLGSKACSEILVQSYAAFLDVVVMRPFFIYGPGQNKSMLIPRLMNNIALGNTITLQGESGIRLNPIHVEDATNAIVNAMLVKGSSTYNIAGPDILSLKEICEIMGEYLGKSPVFKFENTTAHDLIADINAMETLLSKPKIHLRDRLNEI